MFILIFFLKLLAVVGTCVVLGWVFLGVCAGLIKFWIFVTENKGDRTPLWTYPVHLIACIVLGSILGSYMYAYVGAVELNIE